MKYFYFFLALIAFNGHSQKGTISGTITDKDSNNSALPFANVLIKGTSVGTTSDENGKYSLQVDAGSYVIEFSFLGYETVEKTIKIKAGENLKLNQSLGSGNGVMSAPCCQGIATFN